MGLLLEAAPRRAVRHPHQSRDDVPAPRGRRPRPSGSRNGKIKDELRQAINHPDQVPRDELSSHVQYDDGSPEKFLRRLWRDLFGGEPVSRPRAGLSPGAAKPEAASGSLPGPLP
jgi:hypothetical protein